MNWPAEIEMKLDLAQNISNKNCLIAVGSIYTGSVVQIKPAICFEHNL